MNNKMKSLVLGASLILGTHAHAATQILTGEFATIKDVSILQTSPLAITGLTLGNGDSCQLGIPIEGNVGFYPGDQTMKIGSTTNANSAGANLNEVVTSGTCLEQGTAALGFYEIDGAAGATVNVTIVDGTSTNVNVVPSGCAANYDGASNGDDCTAVNAAAGAVAIQLASAGDTTTLGEGTPEVGKSLIALGGTATSAAVLDAGTDYLVDFEINVTY